MKRFIGPPLLSILFASAVFGAPGLPAPDAGSISPPEETYVLLVNDSGMEWSRWTAGLEESGIRPRFFFPPDAALMVLEGAGQSLRGEPGVPARIYAQLTDEELEALSVRSTPLRVSASALRFLQSPRDGHAFPPPGPDRIPLAGDALEAPTKDREEPFWSCTAAERKRSGSEYMLKSVSVNVILVESIGGIDADTEYWVGIRETEVTNEIIEGLNNLTGRYDRAAGLAPQWYLHYYFGRTDGRARTAYEPINRPTDGMGDPGIGEGLWVRNIMRNFGYSDLLSKWDMVHEFNGDTRNADQTKWAYTIFVADSYWDLDGVFTDGRFAYAWVGGPYQIQTYDNDNWKLWNMHYVTQHETGHIFHAADEYATSECTCSQTSGYISYANENCENSCAYAWNCSMRGQTTADLCAYTRGHIGWGDNDGDAVPDPVDIEPSSVLFPYTPDPTANRTLAYTGYAEVVARANQNYAAYACDINVLNLSNVQYRVDGGAWTNAAASDGGFNAGQEAFGFSVTLASGVHTVQTRAVDELGQTETSYATDTVTVAGPGEPTGFKVVKSGTNLILDWTVPGTGCTPTGYAVYSGTIGVPNSHNQSRTCSITAPPSVAPSWVFPDNSYILVTAFNETVEGSYGRSYPGNAERSPSAARCRPAQFTQSCP